MGVLKKKRTSLTEEKEKTMISLPCSNSRGDVSKRSFQISSNKSEEKEKHHRVVGKEKAKKSGESESK